MQEYGALRSGEREVFRAEANGGMIPIEHARFKHLCEQVDDRWLPATAISDAHIDGPSPERGR
jgi:hypothetical protein